MMKRKGCSIVLAIEDERVTKRYKQIYVEKIKDEALSMPAAKEEITKINDAMAKDSFDELRGILTNVAPRMDSFAKSAPKEFEELTKKVGTALEQGVKHVEQATAEQQVKLVTNQWLALCERFKRCSSSDEDILNGIWKKIVAASVGSIKALKEKIMREGLDILKRT